MDPASRFASFGWTRRKGRRVDQNLPVGDGVIDSSSEQAPAHILRARAEVSVRLVSNPHQGGVRYTG